MSTAKRKIEEVGAIDDFSKQKDARKDYDARNDYNGFSLHHHPLNGDESPIPLEDGSLSAKDFFVKHIGPRRPCIIDALPTLPSGKPPTISLKQLKHVAGDKEIQVERRYASDETFGQNRTTSRQLVMTVSDFIENLVEGDNGDLLYLSTQDTDSDDAFQVPCRELLDSGYIADNVPWAGNLVLHSCNLWVGAAKKGSSSGLHHDYHDNFYLLIRGTKRFRLYSPDCAQYMYTHGKIDRVFSNGVISYVGNETRADGVPLAALESSPDDDANGDKEAQESDDDDEEEDGIFFGKGLEDASDSDSIEIDESGRDDYDEVMGANEQAGSDRPNSFSMIDVKTLQDPTNLASKFPKFSTCKECIIEIKEGQTLYLPSGWFHEVMSSSRERESNHTALNYWYHPPDAVLSFEQPYKDSFLKDKGKH